MILTKKSLFTGKIHSREIPITEEQLNDYYNGDQVIQMKFPFLSSDDREFIMTGVTPEEWDEFIPNE